MAICWWCSWGWPEHIWDIYERAFRDLNGGVYDSGCDARAYWALNYGPAHCTWADENFDSAESDLEHFDEWAEKWNTDGDGERKYTPDELVIVRRSLQELVALPIELRSEPKDYDGEDPDNYPPPRDWVMVSR